MSCAATPRLTHRGYASLLVVVFLLLGTSLALLYSHQALLIELRASADQVRATTARHSAQAGQDWALALLNDLNPRGANCQPSAGANAGTDLLWRDRYLQQDPGSQNVSPRGNAQAACVHDGTSWTCTCPSTAGARGMTSLSAPGDDQEHPAFQLQWEAGSVPGQIALLTLGCSHLQAACAESGNWPLGLGRAHLRQSYALLGQLNQRPPAAITAAGDITLGPQVQVSQPDPAVGAWTLASGGNVHLQPGTRLIGSPGTPPLATLWQNDTRLSLSLDGLLRRYLRLPATWLRRLPTVQQVDCPAGTCSATELDAALAREPRTLWIDGDLTLNDAVTRGTPQRPLLLIVRGRLDVAGAPSGYGLWLAGSIRWQSGAAASWSGALLSAGTVTLDGPVDIRYDAAAIERAGQLAGSWVAVAGSWQDLPED
jgi:hypothetical protein